MYVTLLELIQVREKSILYMPWPISIWSWEEIPNIHEDLPSEHDTYNQLDLLPDSMFYCIIFPLCTHLCYLHNNLAKWVMPRVGPTSSSESFWYAHSHLQRNEIKMDLNVLLLFSHPHSNLKFYIVGDPAAPSKISLEPMLVKWD